MKFRNRLVLAYATVALLVSLVLGTVIGGTSLQYETNSQKNNLLVSAKSYVTQMDENLRRMDAIMQYILSNPDILESITLLARTSEVNIPIQYVRSAESTIRVGISTSYIMKNSYRTVFFNENSFLASSAIYTADADKYVPNQRLNTGIDPEDIPYLQKASDAQGKSVIVTGHKDPWGEDSDISVFSLVKELRGEGMGFLEVENRMESLELLEKSDPYIRFIIVANGKELLYASDKDYGADLSDSDYEMLKNLQEETVLTEKGDIYAKASSEDFPLTVLAWKSRALMDGERQRIFFITFLSVMLVFSVSLVFIIFLSGVLTRPIKRLQEVVDSTNIENLQDPRRLEGIRGSDEFQDLMNSYQTMTSRLDTALQNEKRASMLQLQAQFDTLQTQVSPHFIYNVLNIISSRAVMADDEIICEMCGALGNMLRYSTNNKERYAPVKKELEYLKNYFYLLKMRYENRLEVSLEIDKKIGDQIIPKMTLQQLVENCVKHGFHDTDEHMHIFLTGKVQDGQWSIRVQDNGSGISEEKLGMLRKGLNEVGKDMLERSVPAEMEIGGMGIVNTYARCLLLYREELIFQIENVQDGHGLAVTVGQKKLFDR